MSDNQPKLGWHEKRFMERKIGPANTEALQVWQREFAASTNPKDHIRASMIQTEIERRARRR